MQTLLTILLVAAGLAVGLVIGYLAAGIRAARRSAGLEAANAELRSQAAGLSGQLGELRARLEQEQAERIKAQTQLAEAMAHLEQERQLLEEARSRLTETFKATAGDTLQMATSSFLDLARQTLEKLLAQAKGEMDIRHQALQGLVNPLSDALRQLEEHMRGLERARQEAYAGLVEQIKALAIANQDLQATTGNLVSALRTPRSVGSWGQVALERVVELAGMTEHCDFAREVSVDSQEGRLRPDLVVHLPGGRKIVVDAKASFEAYHEAVSAASEQERQKALARHAAQIRAHVNGLAAKAYWEQFDQAPEFVVMFIPGEAFFAAAVSMDRALLEEAMAKRVIIATPTTLLALLRAIAYGWRQDLAARNAQQIRELGRQVYERIRSVTEHLTEVGRGLEKANAAYNSAIGSIESRLLPAARRLKDLGAGGDGELNQIEPVQTCPRQITASELRPEKGADDGV
ncbi:MAG: DNA recombination protein RmuC [Sedimentisphaerales bacterium]|jgi:DNA recombination protein RmuC|nr:DNA recombination protein RmuC [Sedimentisphaerales bacterium]